MAPFDVRLTESRPGDGRAGDARPEQAPTNEGHRHRRWPFVIGGLVIVMVVATAVPIVLYATREDPGQKDVGEAVNEFRASSTSLPAQTGMAPEPGVYIATGDGREALSFPPLGQHDSARIPMTVEARPNDCFRFTIDFNEAHWQRWDYCTVGGRMIEKGGATYQRWDLGATTIDNLSTFPCRPTHVVLDLADVPGTKRNQRCSGTNSAIKGTTTSAGPSTYIGPERVTVGNRSVPTRHYRQQRTLTGAQEGYDHLDLWFAEDSGLPVKAERDVEVKTDSPIGKITYTESGDWTLSTLVPRS